MGRNVGHSFCGHVEARAGRREWTEIFHNGRYTVGGQRGSAYRAHRQSRLGPRIRWKAFVVSAKKSGSTITVIQVDLPIVRSAVEAAGLLRK